MYFLAHVPKQPESQNDPCASINEEVEMQFDNGDA